MCTLCGVARLNVYLPDELADEARRAGLNISAVTQEAIRRTLAASSTDAWLATLTRPALTVRVRHERALEALDTERDEGATGHG